MTIEELGKKVKEKYPQYNTYSDLEVGQKTLEKYPVYQNRIDPPKQKSSVSKVIDFFIGSEKGFGQTLGSAVTAATMGGKVKQATQDYITAGKNILSIADTVSDPAEKKRLTDQANEMFKRGGGYVKEAIPAVTKSTKQIVGEAIGVGADILSFGTYGTAAKGMKTGELALKVAQPTIRAMILKGGNEFRNYAIQQAATSGGLGILYGVSNELEKNNTVANAFKKGIISGTISALGSGLISAGQLGYYKATSPAETSKIFREAIGMPKNVKKAEERSGKYASDILIKEGGGTAESLKNKYESLADEMNTSIKTAIENKPDVSFYKKEVKNIITNKVQKEYPTTLTRGQVEKLVDTLDLAALQGEGQIPATLLNDLRSEIGTKYLKNSDWLLKELPQKKEATKIAYFVMADLIKDRFKTEDVAQLFRNESAYLKGYEAVINKLSTGGGPVSGGAKVVSAAAGAAVGGLVGFMKGGMVGGIIGSFLGVGTEELARSTIGRTTFASALRKAGLISEKISEAEITKFINLLIRNGVIKGIGSY